ncbi:dimethylamine monooxygenase subunit DmmA family protein [Yaniella flava]|uniref:Dimethylamine monooxygenase subunit DmmA family protein n=1 Tax=Yaniella flava TaxID=287930 RepID=A0ABN2UZR9_9MICC
MQEDITTPPADIRSRPEYWKLKAVPNAQWNLILAESEGMASVIRMLNEAPKGFSARTHLVYLTADHSGTEDYLEQLEDFGPVSVNQVTTRKAALLRLNKLLSSAKMGTRLYAVGSESFLALVVREAGNHGINHESIVTELKGSLARRVQCVHCKFIAEDVTTSIYDCPRCSETLEVRDHYSRRIAAFQGVSATVETPGQQPEAEKVYP